MHKLSLKRIYVYFFSFLGLILLIIAGTRLISLTLKTFVFTQADMIIEYPARPVMDPKTQETQPTKTEIEEYQQKQRTANRQRELAESLSMVIVGLPLYLYHWKQVKNLKEEA